MNKVQVNIWGRLFELDAICQTFSGTEITDNQSKALELIPSVDFDTSLEGVQQYIRKNYAAELGVDTLDNIFKYVMPKSLFITRNQKMRELAIICKFKLDMEHGIAVVYENEKFREAGPQDIIL